MQIRILATTLSLLVGACGSSAAPASAPPSGAPLTLASASSTITPPASASDQVSPAPPSASATPSLAATAAVTAPPTRVPTAPPTPVPTFAPTPARSLRPGETPKPTPIDVASLLTVTLGVVNLADDAVTVAVDLVDPDTGEVTSAGKKTLVPYDQISQDTIQGDYRLTFTHASGRPGPVTCDLHVIDGDGYQFVVLPEDVAIARNGSAPTQSADLFISTSQFCKPKS